MIGKCSDCKETGELHYRPDQPLADQTRPSICYICRERRARRLREQRRNSEIYEEIQ